MSSNYCDVCKEYYSDCDCRVLTSKSLQHAAELLLDLQSLESRLWAVVPLSPTWVQIHDEFNRKCGEIRKELQL